MILKFPDRCLAADFVSDPRVPILACHRIVDFFQDIG